MDSELKICAVHSAFLDPGSTCISILLWSVIFCVRYVAFSEALRQSFRRILPGTACRTP